MIEVLVVLVILGLMVGLVVARGPPRSPALTLRATVAGVTQELRQARARAIAGNRSVRVGFDLRRRSYGVPGGPQHAFAPEATVTLTTPAGTADGIGFAPDGSSTGGNLLFVEGSRREQVAVDWLTGRVHAADVR